MKTLITLMAALATMPAALHAQDAVVEQISVTEWKAVYGRIEARDRIPARARLGGTLVSLSVVEGDLVTAGQVVAQIVDAKINFQLAAIDAQLSALSAQLDNARVELTRGEDLLARGVTTAQRLDALRTQVDVLTGQIAAVGADAMGLDWTVNLAQARQRVGDSVALQGNLDPMALFGGEEAIRTQARRVIDDFGAVGKGGHVFNLGHGISRFTPPEAVAILTDEVHKHSRGKH